MTAWLLVAPMLLPVLAAGVSFTLSGSRVAQQLLGVGVLTLVLADSVMLLVMAERDGPRAATLGGWPAPLGITLLADRLSALLLMVSVAVALAVLVFSIGQGFADSGRSSPYAFHPAYLLLTGGICLAYLAGDLFNLFVAFEMMLTSSYVLITLGAGADRIRAGMTYTITSLASSLLFLTSIALCYAAVGTVNLADLSRRMDAVPDGMVAALSVLLLVVFGIKAAAVPLHFWLPDSYPTAPAPITAVFAALLTKVGVYAMVRTQTLLFPRDGTWTLLAIAAIVTLLVGVLGAVAQDDINRLLSFVLVSHIGFMLFGLALFDVPGLTGTVLYTVHHIAVQAGLFLVAGIVVRLAGTASLTRLARAAPPPPVVAGLFLVPALSLAGIPPTSGFVAKFVLLQAGGEHGGAVPVLVGAALVTSLLTLYAMARLWRAVFSAGPERPPPGRYPGNVLILGAAAGIVLTGVGIAVGAGELGRISERAAHDLLERDGYREAVLGEEAG
ncbi:Na+/H+ antiporter subunit D [Streptomyces sp. 3MP-14]|uniref:Na+/H+ antiporter subunit D n=1 Tax=Streptomyces mimosae TaxID=2586635 RepID=A0A5N5ZUR3_9ACTN|nr:MULTISPECIES: Na+/H+ antiporter subunit D [Streptomyces]KAB8159529.1 Na+/H+ antiporter subunit D [Streptomyces mimosae]KAB8172807.1 Na+/H+ antiporter subunit D [Streptomyces sp. 3MP-14]